MKPRAWSARERKVKEDLMEVACPWFRAFRSVLGKDNGKPVWLDDSSLKEIDHAIERILETIKSARVITHLTVVE